MCTALAGTVLHLAAAHPHLPWWALVSGMDALLMLAALLLVLRPDLAQRIVCAFDRHYPDSEPRRWRG